MVFDVFGGNFLFGVHRPIVPRDEATSCQAKQHFSAPALLVDDLCSNMLASEVERIMFIKPNRHVIDEARELDTALEQAQARVPMKVQNL